MDSLDSNEVLLLVDENDRPVGRQKREVVHRGNGLRHRAFLVMVFNKEQELLLARRNSHKLFSGLWDGTVASHPLNGETYQTAILREVEEEIGVSAGQARRIGEIVYQAQDGNGGAENEFCALFAITTKQKITANREEIDGIRWMDFTKLRRDVKENPQKYTPWLRFALETASVRRALLEQCLQVSLQHIGNPSFDTELASKNCENMIGVTQVPIGVAGPLKLLTQEGQKAIYLPLATTEAALVASVNRGCKAVTEAGGCRVFAERVGISRGPVFATKGVGEGRRLARWIEKNQKKLAKVAESVSPHIKLLHIEDAVLGRALFLRFVYDTQDAMGMNMATIATQKAAELVCQKTGARLVSLAGNFDVDKKPSYLNFIRGRGWKVWAEVKLPARVVRKVLKTTPKALVDTFEHKIHLGSALSGLIGQNAHFANIAAALFIATGQDVAHTVEASLGITSIELAGNDLYCSVYLPDLPLGTVGGGTGLPTQKEALSLLGVYGNGNARGFAEIVAGAVLAGEISLLASLAEGSLASSHAKLAWGKSEARSTKFEAISKF